MTERELRLIEKLIESKVEEYFAKNTKVDIRIDETAIWVNEENLEEIRRELLDKK